MYRNYFIRGIAVALALNALSNEYQHGLSYIYPLAYPPDFKNFSYVNPDAPKGGTIRVAAYGSYDSFSDILDKGQAAEGISFTGHANLIYDRLLEPALDEPTSQYGRLASGVAVADDHSWVAFKLRENAFWHDGKPITATDLIFTFNTIKKHGSAVLKTSLQNVERIESLNGNTVVYHMRPESELDPSIPLLLGRMAVFPAHYWKTRDISKTQTQPPLGSGPFRITHYKLGRSVTFARVPNYWGKSLPVNRGRYNFDEVKFDYFRDDFVRKEAHVAGVVAVAHEGVAKNWVPEYNKLPAYQNGLLRKQLLPISSPSGLWWSLLWNLRLERFQDPRVREALTLLYDFEYINRTLNYGFYNHGTSVFQNSEMAHHGYPTEAERLLLEPNKNNIPARVFGSSYQPPTSTGFGWNRDNMKKALELFSEAGWEVQDGKMLHRKTKEHFRIAFVVVSKGLVRTLLPYQNTLHRVGIKTSIVAPEVANWLHRMRTGKFDAAQRVYTPTHTPGLALRSYFGSDSAKQAYGGNWSGIVDPVVDELIETIISAQDQRSFLAATRALDRVLLWNFYFIPRSSPPGYRLVYWDRFGKVETVPLLRQAFIDTWWFDQQRALQVDRFLGDAVN